MNDNINSFNTSKYRGFKGFGLSNFLESGVQSLLGSGLGLLGNWIQNKQMRKNMRLQSDLQGQLMDKSNDIWKEQNATQVENQKDLTRSNPMLQKQGLIDAGMSPNSMFGGMSGNVAAAPSGTAPSSGSVGLGQAANPFAGFGDLMDIFTKSKEMELLDKNIAKTDAEEEKITAEGVYQRIQNIYAGQLGSLDVNKKTAEIGLLKTQIAVNNLHLEMGDDLKAELAAKVSYAQTQADILIRTKESQIYKILQEQGITEENFKILKFKEDHLEEEWAYTVASYMATINAQNASAKAALMQGSAALTTAAAQSAYLGAMARIQPAIGAYYDALGDETKKKAAGQEIVNEYNKFANQYKLDAIKDLNDLYKKEDFLSHLIQVSMVMRSPTAFTGSY